MMPTILLIRHARTPFNNPADERIRGYSDVPISYEGKQGLLKTAEFLRKQDFPITRILSTPLQRGMMTAEVIGQAISAKVIPEHGLLPWNLGKLSGVPIKEAAVLMDHLQDTADIKAPEGESYRDFFNRWSEALTKMQIWAEEHPDEVLAGVVHSRNLLALPSLLGAKSIGDVPVKGGPDPESVTQLLLNDAGNWEMKVIWKGL